MSSVADHQPGNQWGNPKYVHGCAPILNSVTDNAALAADGFMTPAEYATLVSGSPATYGLLVLGPAFAGEFHFGGTGSDNDATATYLICAIKPVYAASDTERKTPLGYVEYPVAAGVITLSGVLLGADGLAGFGGSAFAGASDTDRMADIITETYSCPGVKNFSPGNVAADIGPATLVVPAPGAVALRVKMKRGTPSRVFCVGNRCAPLYS